MPPQSEFKVLRDSLAEEIRSGRGKDAVIGELATFAVNLVSVMVQMEAEMGQMRQRLNLYENPHSPPSKESIAWKQEKRERAAKARAEAGSGKAEPRNMGGAKEGHRGVSHGRKAAETVHHVPEKCGNCGRAEFVKDVHAVNKLITDIPRLPKAVTKAHVAHRVTCAECGADTQAPTPGIDGTSIGPSAGAVALAVWSLGNSIDAVRAVLEMCGIRASKSAVGSLIEAASRKLEPEVAEIKKDVARSKSIRIDETGNKIASKVKGEPDKPGWTWMCSGDGAAIVEVTATRSAVILDVFFPFFGTPLTSDGYPGYLKYKIRQRCWAHESRETRYAAKRCGPAGTALHERFAGLLHRAKRAPPDEDLVRRMEGEVLEIAAGYRSLGEGRLATRLENAAPYLFTFVMHPEMHPTNNEAERLLRPIAIQRLIRKHHVTEDGMRAFSRIMTCALTWRMRGLNAYDEFYRCLSTT